MRIEDVDQNFRAARAEGRDVVYADALRAPFAVEGFPWRAAGAPFRRLPAGLGEKETNPGVEKLAGHTAGGAIRFRSDSPVLALRVEFVDSYDMNNMPRSGSAGLDLYRGRGAAATHVATVQPARDQAVAETLLVADGDGAAHDYLLNLPLYGSVGKLEIGVAPGAEIMPPTPHRVARPVLFYGSSITQGACASRPGNAYASLLCRAVDAEQVNLGFAGSAHGEIAIARAIAALDLAAFVLDYDHNAPSAEFLEATHAPFFRAVRDARPELPIVLLSRPDFWNGADCPRRRDVVRATYAAARAAGDERVFFVDGETLFGREHRDACSIDRCHPNDLGFYRMFQAVLPALQAALGA